MDYVCWFTGTTKSVWSMHGHAKAVVSKRMFRAVGQCYMGSRRQLFCKQRFKHNDLDRYVGVCSGRCSSSS